MAFTFPLSPTANQIAVTPLGQRFMYMSADEGWRSIGAARSPAETVGVTIATTMFFVGNPVNIAFSTVATLPSSGVNPPFSFVVSSGQLPTGLSINSSGGVITGTPTVADENYSFMVSVLDSLGFLANTLIFNGTVSGIVTTQYLLSLVDTAVNAELALYAPLTQVNTLSDNLAAEYTIRTSADTTLTAGLAALAASVSDVQNLKAFSSYSNTAGTIAFYVDATSGDDANSGASGHPWKTLDYAMSQVLNIVPDLHQKSMVCNIYFVPGSYTYAGSALSGPSSINYRFTSTTTTAADVTIAFAQGLSVATNTTFEFDNVTVTCSEVASSNHGQVTLLDCVVTTIGTTDALRSSARGSLVVTGCSLNTPATLSSVISVDEYSHLTLNGGSLNNGVTVSAAFAAVGLFSTLTIATLPTTGTVTGAKYAGTKNAILEIGSNVLPGTVAGTLASGAEIV